MEIEIKEIKDRNIWENFLLNCPEKTFLQSWAWGEFNKAMGEKVWRLGVYERPELAAAAQVIKVAAKRGTFLFVPHGPIIQGQETSNKGQVLDVLTDKLKELAKEEGAVFIRVAPIWEKSGENEHIFKKLGFRPAPIHMHPELTWELGINSEEEMFKNMRKTTRYLIKQAAKNPDVKIEKTQKPEDVEDFNRLYLATKERHNFAPFSADYLKNQLKVFIKDNPESISLLLGKYKGETVASGIFVFWQGVAFYHHGASSQKYPKIPVSYLMLWQAILEAKRKNCRNFNFWGIAPINRDKQLIDKTHPWAGLTLFKMGFGGHEKEYTKTQDLPLSFRYWPVFALETLRRRKRGL